MNVYNYVPYLFVTFTLYFLNIFILSIFGFITLKLIRKIDKRKFKLPKVEMFLLSFVIGTSIFISYSFILAALSIFNFFTATLPLILLDVAFLLYSLIKVRNLQNGKQGFSIKLIFDKVTKSQVIFFSIISLSLFFQIAFLWNIMSSNPSLYSVDPFFWFGFTSGLLNEGTIKGYGITYPPGYTIFCASHLLLLYSPDFWTTYYFFKFGPLPYVCFFVFIFGYLIKKIFQKNYLVLSSLIILITTNYVNRRILPFNPSNFACLILLISLLLISSKCPLYLFGFFFPLMYLINPPVAFFYSIAFTLYLILNLFYKEQKLKQYITQIIGIVVVSILILLPYFFFIYYTVDADVFTFIDNNLSKHFSILNTSSSTLETIELFFNLKEKFLYPYYKWFPDQPSNLKMDYVRNQVIFSIFFPCAIFGLFIPLRTIHDRSKSRTILISKCAVILVVLVNFCPYYIGNAFFLRILPAWILIRMLECFILPIIILESFAFNFVLFSLPKYLKLFFYKLKKVQMGYKKKIFTIKRYQQLIVSILLILVFFNYLFYLKFDNYEWDKYHFDSKDVDVIDFIRENISKEKRIVVANDTSDSYQNNIYNLINDYDYYFFNFYLFNSFNDSKGYFNEHEISYVVIKRAAINPDELNNFITDNEEFHNLYENKKYIVYEIIG